MILKSNSILLYKRIILNRLYTALLEKETLDLDNIIEILGERPFAAKSNFKAYLEQKSAQKEELNRIKQKAETEEAEENEGEDEDGNEKEQKIEKEEDGKDTTPAEEGKGSGGLSEQEAKKVERDRKDSEL